MTSGATSGIVDLGPENDARLRRLRIALGLGTGFQLVIVEAEPGPIRREVIRRIQTWSGHDAIPALAAVSLDAEAGLAAQLGGRPGAIVIGLEPADPGQAPAHDWIAELNWNRDALPQLVPGPLILVVSQATHHDLFERAPDLYSWRRHTARVTITARDLAAPLSSPGDRYWLEQRERLIAILAEAGLDPFGRARLSIDLAKVLVQLGDERGASRMFEAVLSSPIDGEDAALVVGYGKLGLAECALLRHDLAAAGELLDPVHGAARLDELGAGLALCRGKLHAADGAWEAAVRELGRPLVSSPAGQAPHLLARARECLAQVAFARGDIMGARRESAHLVHVASPHLDTWGAGLLLRIAAVTIDVYPDEVSPLLDAAFVAAVSSSWRDTMIAIQCLRTRRAWLLGRAELARKELTRAAEWIRSEDPAETHAAVAFCQAVVALAAGSASEDEVAPCLARARELYRSTAPRSAAAAAMLLGDTWRERGRADLDVIAFRLAAVDAKTAADLPLARSAELRELGAALDEESMQRTHLTGCGQSPSCSRSPATPRARASPAPIWAGIWPVAASARLPRASSSAPGHASRPPRTRRRSGRPLGSSPRSVSPCDDPASGSR